MAEKQVTKIDQEVNTYLEKSGTLQGFQKAQMLSKSIGTIKNLLTKDFMEPIMEMQGNKLGFRTDKDGKGGYPMPIVRNCLIEAVLSGVQPVGNQFNIIASNCYITKEGFLYLLKNYPGLRYSITYELPRIGKEKKSAAVDAKIVWSLNGGKEQEKTLHLPIKMNAYMGTDAVLGKADRKSRAWLYNHLTGNNLGDGDAESVETATQDINYEEVNEDEEESIEKGLLEFIENCDNIEELKANEDFFQSEQEKKAYQSKLKELEVKEKKEGMKNDNEKIDMP